VTPSASKSDGSADSSDTTIGCDSSIVSCCATGEVAVEEQPKSTRSTTLEIIYFLSPYLTQLSLINSSEHILLASSPVSQTNIGPKHLFLKHESTAEIVDILLILLAIR
jgi:hypothetical protein